MSRWSDAFWLGMAEKYASQSKDPSTKVGCVIVRPDRTAASFGTNGFPSRVADTPERLADRAWKYPMTIHAELNALLFLRERADGYTLYSTFAPCFEKCAAPIIQAGIDRVVFKITDDPRWKDEQSKAVDLFVEAGLEVCGINLEDGEAVGGWTRSRLPSWRGHNLRRQCELLAGEASDVLG